MMTAHDARCARGDRWCDSCLDELDRQAAREAAYRDRSARLPSCRVDQHDRCPGYLWHTVDGAADVTMCLCGCHSISRVIGP